MDHPRGASPGILARRALVSSFGVFLMASFRLPAAEPDPHSLGNPGEIIVRSVDLDLTADFERKSLRGFALLRVERRSEAAPDAELVLDSRDLLVDRAEEGVAPSSLNQTAFNFGEERRFLGRPLRVKIKQNTRYVKIHYSTSPSASALQWLEPAMTAGGKKPFLFSQSQAIHARSWIPIQDSPAVRVTYDATIRTSGGMTAVMSADRIDAKPGEQGVYHFRMPLAIPAYLIAIAVGDLAFEPLGPRSGIYAEPSVVKKAADEFADTEKMIEAAEKRYGPYRWGRYDILVLPPSFPYGGMENPKLTFATPTVIAGDRSLVALIAHELAHSWSGNLVTNATWQDFWLNEGFTTYVERRIMEDLYGPDRAEMERALGVQELREEMAELKPADQVLQLDLTGRDPDEGVTRVPYEKGALLLHTIEKRFGREVFDEFLRDYFAKHAFQSVTTQDFREHFQRHLSARNPAAAAKVDLDAWLKQPGLSQPFEPPKSPALDAVDRIASDWLTGKLNATEIRTNNWSTLEWLRFLRALPSDLGAGRMSELDKALRLTDRRNAEIAAQWLMSAIRANYEPAFPRLEEFLGSVGRRKYLMPLYGELAKTREGKERARKIYAKARPSYHPIAVASVDLLLGAP